MCNGCLIYRRTLYIVTLSRLPRRLAASLNLMTLEAQAAEIRVFDVM
jgi:hypothetical protein